MQEINLTDIPSITYDTDRFLDVRHGAGRTAKKADAFVEQFGKAKRISFSCLYDQTIAPILISNAMAVAVGTSPESYDIAYNYTGVECAHGDTDTDNTGALTFAYCDPEGSNSIIFPGCFVDRLRIYATSGDNGGRFMIDCEVVTRHNVSTGQAAPGTRTAYPTTYRTIHDMAARQQVDGSDIDMYKVDIEILSNVKFAGFGASGIPSVIARGIPEIAVNGVIGIKHDANTAGLKAKQLTENDIVIELSNNATWASATFGLMGSYAQISSDFDVTNVEDGAFIDLPVKFLAHTSGDLIQIVP